MAATCRLSLSQCSSSALQHSHDTMFKRKPRPPAAVHPYLAGNFAPVLGEYVVHPCEIVHGSVPHEFKGGQYIRNGGNPVHPPESGRHYHW